MPPISPPSEVPLGLWWFFLWISTNSLLIYVFRVLRSPTSRLQEDAKRESEKQLPALNEYLWRLVNESSDDSYEGPLGSADDLQKLSRRVRNAVKPINKCDRLRYHIDQGFLAGSCAIIGAVISGGFYLMKFPSEQVVSLIGIAGFSILREISSNKRASNDGD